ncbi:PLD nuclease N-terminal domain-containing protein [Jiangella rhizosphaerae]|uniref:PLD nuclease N-terminal domain-containing protein n=1 Tax=Jiangella rhizosphaerae TaxID=2293569 RepID=UPI001F358365|nr:PLD nuclease N-terminal domain-containing protein [Jiangella rhizosphaerae]
MVAIALLVYALIDCLQTDSARFRSLNRVAWAAIIVLVPLVGPILWLAIGKLRDRPQRPAAPPRRPLAPDDDPEFLRHLRETDAKHERMLNQWEADLRRREAEIKRKKEAEARAAEEAQRRKEAEARQREDEARQHTDDEDDSR